MAFRDTTTDTPVAAAGAGATVLRVAAGRLCFALITLLVMSMITFASTSLAPEDIARNALGREVTQEQLQGFISERGLDRPLVLRYARWLSALATGDLGTSTVTGRDVSSDIVPKLGNTLILALLTLACSLPLALGLAVYMALRTGGWQDVSLLAVTTVFTALPEFVTGMALIFVFKRPERQTVEWWDRA